MAESLIAATLGAELIETFKSASGASIVGPVDDAGALVAGDAVDELDLEISRNELNLSARAMQRIIEDAEVTVPDILWL